VLPSQNVIADSMTTLYSTHHKWLLGWFLRRMHDSGNAHDLTQDTFVKVLVAGNAAAIDEPKPFLATIAKRLLANHWRREDVERAYLDALANLPEPTYPSPETLSVVMESLLLIDKALSGLSVNAKSAFLLAHLDGLTYAQIGEELGVTTHSVKKYLSAANMACFFAVPDIGSD
jgi:RNA polymerase sigma factor (sigma-70 family)